MLATLVAVSDDVLVPLSLDDESLRRLTSGSTTISEEDAS